MKPKDPLVSILIVNFNGGKVLLECLESLKKIIYLNFETVLVDNGSSDDSVDIVKKFKIQNLKYKIQLVESRSNLGFAGGK